MGGTILRLKAVRHYDMRNYAVRHYDMRHYAVRHYAIRHYAVVHYALGTEQCRLLHNAVRHNLECYRTVHVMSTI